MGLGRTANATLLMHLLAVVGKAYLLENEGSPSSVFSRVSKSSFVADGVTDEWKKEETERLKESIDDRRDIGRSNILLML